MINQIGDEGLINDVEQIKNLNRFVGGVAHSGEDILNKNYTSGVSKILKSYKNYEKDFNESDEKYMKSERKRKGKIKNKQDKIKNTLHM